MKDIYHYWFYHDMLSSSGMPTAEQMKSVAEAGVQVVINLAPHNVARALHNESDLVHSLGMEYLNIPIPWGEPATDSLARFMDAMDAHSDKKILVHCEANYRASAFIMLYRVLRLSWKKEDAIPVMERMWNPEDFPVWEKFITDQLAGS